MICAEPKIDEKPEEKNIFKKIFQDHWEEFKKKYPQFDKVQYEEAVKKMLGCGEEKNGYACYICASCGNMITVKFSCKSSFCLSCGKLYTDNWMEKISETLYEGMCYRHVVLTVPEELRDYFFRDPELLSELMKVGTKMLTEALSEWFRTEVEIGLIVVLHTAGRSGHWNPHLHIIMTSGGLTREGKWRNLGYISYKKLHKKWRDHLFAMLQEKIDSPEIEEKLEKMRSKYPQGLVAYLDKGKMPHSSQGLARYLVKYVVSPPIAISRIIKYDGRQVTYWYKDHQTGKKKVETVDALRFMGLMIQHVLPKGFKRIRYFGLHATCKRPKVLPLLRKIILAVKQSIKGAYRIIKKTFRQRVIESGHRDPLICNKCGDTMFLYFIWHPKYGYIYDFWDKAEPYEPERKERARTETSGATGNREGTPVQMLMPFMQV